VAMPRSFERVVIFNLSFLSSFFQIIYHNAKLCCFPKEKSIDVELLFFLDTFMPTPDEGYTFGLIELWNPQNSINN
jgi:hypothetical protein